MISISKHSDYAIVLLAYFSKYPEKLMSAKELSEAVKLPYPIVSKLLKILIKSEILSSVQGARGGYRMNKSPSSISIASVIEAVEGPISITECATGNHSLCQSETWCSVKPHWIVINQVIKKSLDELSLSSLDSSSHVKNPQDKIYALSQKVS